MRILILLIITFGLGIKSEACECLVTDLSLQIKSSDFIFVGIPLDRTERDGEAIYIFQVNKVWKGNEQSKFQIKTRLGGAACGMFFSLNEEYYVFSTNGKTNSCNGNSKTSKINFDGILKLNLDNEFKIDVGQDANFELTESEAEYFNLTFINERGQFDFKNKKIGFIYEKIVTNKMDYFYKWSFKFNEPDISLFKRIDVIVLTPEEKKLTNDLDAVIILTKKNLTKSRRDRLIKKVKKRTNAQQYVCAIAG